MEMLLRGARDVAQGELLDSGVTLPPMKAFMDDITTLVHTEEGTKALLQRLNDLFVRCRMRVKPKKSRSLSIVKGLVKEIHYTIGGDVIPTVKEEPVKSLGRWYKIPLTDRHCGTELQATTHDGLETIDKTDLPGKLKVWMFQHGLLPRLLWPLQVYEVTLTRVETIQRHINKYLQKWLGLPPSFTTVGLYSKTAKVRLPISSLEEEFKTGKVRLQMMMRDSPDPVIREAAPEVKSGDKWSAKPAIKEAEASLKTKEIMGAVQTGRGGLGRIHHRWISQQDEKGTREMVIEEVRTLEEEKRQSKAASFAKQCTWTHWEEAEQKQIKWPSLFTMEPLRISFILRSTYDLLPTASNLKLWGLTQDDTCSACGTHRATLEHVLSSCNSSLAKYTYRHNCVLRVVADTTREQCEGINNLTIDIAPEETHTSFIREGSEPKKTAKLARAKLLEGTNDWNIITDLDERMIFPTHIATTNLRPDIIIWSDGKKCVHLVELTVPWEGNLEVANERKRTKYEPLQDQCQRRGWECQVLPIEVGCRGFVARSTMSFLRGIGMNRAQQRKTIKALEDAAETASSWIWQAARPMEG